MIKNKYKKYLSELQRAILRDEPEEFLYEVLKYVNNHADKIYPLEYYIQDTKNNYILHYNNCSEYAIPKDSILGKTLISGDFEIDINTGNIIIPEEIARERIKETQIKWKNNHLGYYQKYNEEHPKIHNTQNIKYYTFFRELEESDISGICFSCSKITLFCENHHVFGRKENDFTLSICCECHYKYRGKNHCIGIGRKIENNALTRQ